MNELTVGSLFAGIGGFDLGFERAGMRTVWQVEQDEFCRRVLEKHFPDAERFVDVRKVGADELAWVDVICGGFPCQDISVAGKGAGIGGERSGLWAEMFRVIGELRPRYVVAENVPALTYRGLDRVLADLASIGFDAEWDCLPASDFGAPHRRDRIWLVAYPRGEWPLADPDGLGGAVGREARDLACAPRAIEADGGQRQRGGDASNDRCADVADADGSRRRSGEREVPPGQPDADRSRAVLSDASVTRLEGREQSEAAWTSLGELAGGGGLGRRSWPPEPGVGRVAHGVPDWVDRLRGLGNALVPQIAEWIGERIVSYESERQVAA